MLNLNNFKSAAISAALTAGDFLKKNFGKKHTISYKGRIDLVTEVDKKSEDIISKIIRKKFPSHNLVCEEGTCTEFKSEYKWFIDPLDGTTNFAHNFPVFCVSIGLQKNEDMILGVVYVPMLEELFWGIKSGGAPHREVAGGAYLNGKKIRVSRVKTVKEALLATGFPYWIKKESSNKPFRLFEKFVLSAQAVRRAGSAAFDLCCLAAGRFDGFWEEGLHSWDTAAGTLILEEAGGISTDFKGNKFKLSGKEILASNKFIHKEMLNICNGLAVC